MSNSISKYILVYGCVCLIAMSFNCSKNENISGIVDGFQQQSNFIKTLGGTKNESAQAVTKTTDGGYAVLGYTQSTDFDVSDKFNESFDYWVLKFDVNDDLQWQKTYGGSGNDIGSDIIQTIDGGYAIIGSSQSSDGDVSENAGSNDFWISKLDNLGNMVWEKSFGFSGSDSGISLIQTNDSGYLLTGILDVTASGELGNSKNSLNKHAGGAYWAIKLDNTGEKQWSKFFGGTFTDSPHDVVQTEDNGYLIVGSSDSNDVDISGNKGSYDFWVIKISETGILNWEKSYGGSEIDEARAITKTNDGNYMIIGDTRSSDIDISGNKGIADLWVIKITPSGNVIWEKSFGGSSFDVGRSISSTKDSGFIIAGSSRSTDGDLTNNRGQNDAWVLKIDANANLEWQKTIGGSDIDFAYDIVELDDKTIVAVGESNSSSDDIPENKGLSDLLLMKLK